MEQDHLLEQALDNELIRQAMPALEGKSQVSIDLPVTNLNRTVGTMLSYHISKRHGKEGLPDDTIKIKLRGHGGQSLGFALAQGVIDAGFVPESNVVVGNVCLYGATRGKVSERMKQQLDLTLTDLMMDLLSMSLNTQSGFLPW